MQLRHEALSHSENICCSSTLYVPHNELCTGDAEIKAEGRHGAMGKKDK